jgi:glycosyltransferase involved in cell wall biosynthesis
MCTYNRANLLDGAVTSVLAQTQSDTPPFELIVVDNNSSDATGEVVAGLAAADPRVRYVFESRQGLSYARNAGIGHARAALIAFIDDDLRADPDWVAAIVRAFDEHPDVDVVGGRVLPIWPSRPPAWLTQDHWAPLALADHGDTPFLVTVERPICLIGAGACRRTVFDAVGTFVTDFQRVQDSIGSLEDHDFIVRVLGTGRRGLYVPSIIVRAAVQPERLERSYHRRWHLGHGHFHALLRSELVERTSIGTLFGIPAHLYRQALGDLAGWAAAAATGNLATAFLHEVRLRFFIGFFRTRLREFLRRPSRERMPAPSVRPGIME